MFFIRNYTDAKRINDSKISNNANSCTIVGAGLVGLEMAEALKKKGGRENGVRTDSSNSSMNVTVVEMADHVLPNLLDKGMAKIVQRELEGNGVNVILGERVAEIQGRDGNANVKTCIFL